MPSERLLKQIAFLNEIEKLKLVFRANMTLEAGRAENSAEHSWHVTLMAVVFSEHAATSDLNLLKVVKMLLIHDLVEIDVGDTWAFAEHQASKYSDEKLCAERIIALLPQDQTAEFLAIWVEFERRETAEAKFAAVIDGLHPLINHLLTGDDKSTKVAVEKVQARKAYIKDFAPSLWPLTQSLIDRSVEAGLYS